MQVSSCGWIFNSFISIFQSNMSEFNQLISDMLRSQVWAETISRIVLRLALCGWLMLMSVLGSRCPLSGTGSLPSHNANALPCLTCVYQEGELTVFTELFDPADLSALKPCPQSPRSPMCVCIKWVVTNSSNSLRLAAGPTCCWGSTPWKICSD